MERENCEKISAVVEEALSGGEIKHLAVNEAESLVTLIVEVPAGTDEKLLSRQLAKIIKLDMGYKGLKLSVNTKTEALVKQESATKYITVTSGKGGVGKSTVAGNLAVALARLGQKVGIIDTDIYGPSLPKLFNISEIKMQMTADKKIIPMMTDDGVALMSTELLTEDDLPLMWRGPMLSRMLGHFFEDVLWEDFDYIIVDLPPGTGDVPLDIKKYIPEARAIVVTTPNKMAAHIAIKSGVMAQHLGHKLLGVVENMSYYINPVNGAEERIFGSGGGLAVAESLETTVLAEIPIAQVKADFDGSGIFAVHEENGIAYLGLANKILKLF